MFSRIAALAHIKNIKKVMTLKLDFLLIKWCIWYDYEGASSYIILHKTITDWQTLMVILCIINWSHCSGTARTEMQVIKMKRAEVTLLSHAKKET